MKKIIFVVVIILLIITGAYLGRKSIMKDLKLSKENLLALQDTLKEYRIKIDSMSLYAAEQSAIILSQKDAIELGLIEKQKFKKLYLTEVVTVSKLEWTIKVLKDSLKLAPEVVYIIDTSGTPAVKLPFKWRYDDKYLSLETGVRENRTTHFDLTMAVNGDIIIGGRRGKPIATFTTDNPYVKVSTMSTVIIQDDKKWYDNPWLVSGVSFVGGIVLGAALR